MPEISSDIIEKYKELNKRLDELCLEKEKLDEEHQELLDDYNSSRKAFNDTCDIYTKVKKRLDDRKYKFIATKHTKHINLVMLTTLIAAFSCASIYASLGFPGDKVLLYWGSAILAPVSGMIDIKFFWDKLREKYSLMFDELDSTKATRDTLDRIYVQKLKNEKEMNDLCDKVKEHTKSMVPVNDEKNNVQKEVNNLRISFFEDMLGVENKLTDDNQLVLK